MIVKKAIRKISSYYSSIACKFKTNKDIIWISLGENCLPDDILKRHHKKSYSSVFASGRSNIEYILSMEEDKYDNLLNRNYLYKTKVGEMDVIRSSYYAESSLCYNELHLNGFEFTHHNPLDNIEDKKSFERRIERMTSQKGVSNFVFLYHHRISEKSNIDELLKHLNKIKNIYQVGNKKCFVILFYQSICSSETPRGIEFKGIKNNILEFHFKTKDIWSGDNEDIFWARVDDDLIKEMIKKSEKTINSNI